MLGDASCRERVRRPTAKRGIARRRVRRPNRSGDATGASRRTRGRRRDGAFGVGGAEAAARSCEAAATPATRCIGPRLPPDQAAGLPAEPFSPYNQRLFSAHREPFPWSSSALPVAAPRSAPSTTSSSPIRATGATVVSSSASGSTTRSPAKRRKACASSTTASPSGNNAARSSRTPSRCSSSARRRRVRRRRPNTSSPARAAASERAPDCSYPRARSGPLLAVRAFPLLPGSRHYRDLPDPLLPLARSGLMH